MTLNMKKRITDADTFCVVASTRKLAITLDEQHSIRRQSAVDIEREVIARERMKMLRRMAVR